MVVYLNEYTKGVIAKYGIVDKTNFVFSIVDSKASAIENHTHINNFIRYINQHIKNFAKVIEIDEKISTYYARHTFATTAIRKGASMEFVSEALKHTNMKTTMNYFAGFENETKKEFAKKLMEF